MTDTNKPGRTSRRIVLIACSKTKKPCPPDRRPLGRVTPIEFYGGALFEKRVAYAERNGLPWMVLSAKYGVWVPGTERVPYDATMNEKDPAEFAAWHLDVANVIIEELWEAKEDGATGSAIRPNKLAVEIHAGKLYAHPLTEILESVGIQVELPCKGLGIGEQLSLYTRGRLAA